MRRTSPAHCECYAVVDLLHCVLGQDGKNDYDRDRLECDIVVVHEQISPACDSNSINFNFAVSQLVVRLAICFAFLDLFICQVGEDVPLESSTESIIWYGSAKLDDASSVCKSLPVWLSNCAPDSAYGLNNSICIHFFSNN